MLPINTYVYSTHTQITHTQILNNLTYSTTYQSINMESRESQTITFKIMSYIVGKRENMYRVSCEKRMQCSITT